MKLLGIVNTQIGETEYEVLIYDITVFVSVFKTRKPGNGSRITIYKQELKVGSQKFNAAIKGVKTEAQPGSQVAEWIADCDSNLIR